MTVCNATVRGSSTLQAGDISDCMMGWPYAPLHASTEAAQLCGESTCARSKRCFLTAAASVRVCVCSSASLGASNACHRSSNFSCNKKVLCRRLKFIDTARLACTLCKSHLECHSRPCARQAGLLSESNSIIHHNGNDMSTHVHSAMSLIIHKLTSTPLAIRLTSEPGGLYFLALLNTSFMPS